MGETLSLTSNSVISGTASTTVLPQKKRLSRTAGTYFDTQISV
jgi:hypothetical protein